MPAKAPYADARRRVETLIGIAAPALDLILLFGDRLSRAIGAPDDEPPAAVRRAESSRRPLDGATPAAD